jgi:hypothetical protein
VVQSSVGRVTMWTRARGTPESTSSATDNWGDSGAEAGHSPSFGLQWLYAADYATCSRLKMLWRTTPARDPTQNRCNDRVDQQSASASTFSAASTCGKSALICGPTSSALGPETSAR